MSCRHEFPKLFLNMQHGERLGYAVLLLDQILNDTEKKRLDVHIIYDIACVLKSHLQKKNTFTKYQDFKFGIPVFHSYGHRGDCQVKNSIRRLDSFGLMDGELMERLWSYLRSFSKITKEMTPAHRTDLLSDALLHFGSKKMGNIGKYLVFLFQKATRTLNSCDSEIKTICSKLPAHVDEEIIKSWKKEEDNAVSQNGKLIQKTPSDWKQVYYLKLKDFYKESALVLMSEKVCDAASHQRKANRLKRNLTSFEKLHKVNTRCKTTDRDFRSQHMTFLRVKSNETASTLYSRCSERMMLLTLKKRYADGSAIATRLSKQINKVWALPEKIRTWGVEDILFFLLTPWTKCKFTPWTFAFLPMDMLYLAPWTMLFTLWKILNFCPLDNGISPHGQDILNPSWPLKRHKLFFPSNN